MGALGLGRRPRRPHRADLPPGHDGGSVLLVIDPLDLPSNADFHLLMWAVWNGGGVRGEDEYARVFSRAGLALTRVIPTDTPFSILEGRLAD
jgi:hypothetical protein